MQYHHAALYEGLRDVNLHPWPKGSPARWAVVYALSRTSIA